MGEIDRKPIESVQAAITLFGKKNDQRKIRSTSSDELEKEKELECLVKDLAYVKVQLESKDSAYKQAILKLDHYQEKADELSNLLKCSELERDIYINKCREGRMRENELEYKMEEMADKLKELVKMREHISHVMSELKAAQGGLLSMETELAAAREEKLEAMTQTEMIETAFEMEKVKTEGFLSHVSELNDTIFHLKMAIEVEKEKCAVLSKKEAVSELATVTLVEAQEELEHMKKQLDTMQSSENRLQIKSIFIDSLQLELQQVNELHSSSPESATCSINELTMLKSDMELQKRMNLEQAVYISLLETELNHLKLKLSKANEEAELLNCATEIMRQELEKNKIDIDEIRGRETDAQVEIALLKAELHRGRSKMAASEAAEVRATGEKSGLYFTVQQLALEAEEVKKETQKLKEEAGKTAEETENAVFVEPPCQNASHNEEITQSDKSKTVAEERKDDTSAIMSISVEEYEILIKKAEKADQVPEPVPENRNELEILKKELDIATVKIGEFRTRAQQAASRAEVAEKAKSALEEQIRRWKEQKERRKAAIAALREESISRESDSVNYEQAPKHYQTLGKVLNMKF